MVSQNFRSRFQRVHPHAGCLALRAKEAATKHMGDAIRQIEYTLRCEIQAASGPARSLSEKRRQDMYVVMCKVVTSLRKMDIPVHDPRYITRKSVIALCVHWEKSNQFRVSTIDHYVSTFRRFMVMIGRVNVVPCGEEWRQCLKKAGIDLSEKRRERSASRVQMVAVAKQVRLDDVLPEIHEVSPVSASALLVASTFALRPSAALAMRAAPCGTRLVTLVRGKWDYLTYSDDPALSKRQMEAETFALQVIRSANPEEGTLSEPGLTAEQMRRRFYFVMDRVGVTRSQLGVRPCDFRLHYAPPLPDQA